MCVIMLKKQGVAMPPSKVLENCWDSNSDGAGFMYAKGGKVHIRKGFMKLKKLKEALNELPDDVKNGCIIVHFRIGTHGAVSQECTHPFPVCDDYEAMRKTEATCDFGMAHNGVIGFATNQKEVEADKGLTSDSMWFAKHIASKYMDMLELNDDYEIHPLMNAAIGHNKFAFLRGDGYAWVIGEWAEVGDDKPYWFSNRSFEMVRYRAPKTPYQSDYSLGRGYQGVSQYFHDWDDYGQPQTDAPVKMDKSFTRSSSKMSPIIRVDPKQRDLMRKKMACSSCQICTYRWQLGRPCDDCILAQKGDELPNFERDEGVERSISGIVSLCAKCAHRSSEGTVEPCSSCLAFRYSNRDSRGFELGGIKEV